MEGCPCPACARGYTRGYLHYLVKAREPTAARLLTLHNIAYLQRLMADLRGARARRAGCAERGGRPARRRRARVA